MSSGWEAVMRNRVTIGVADWDRTKADLRRLARALDAGRRLSAADYELNYAAAGDLVAELTRERLRLLGVLRATGPLTIAKLAAELRRDRSAVQADVRRLMTLGLVDRDRGNRLRVPWAELHIRLPLATAA
jgi:predicted transcriptional regulator